MTFWQGVVLLCGAVALAAMLTKNLDLSAKRQAYLARRRHLLTKYNNDEALVDMILAGQMGQGMTTEMLTDSIGEPVEINKRVLATRTEHTYKYGQTGVNRFAVRVHLEDGIVTGWEISGATPDLVDRPPSRVKA